MNVKTILNNAQRHLKDATIGQDGVIWNRSELLEWVRDGYRKLIVDAKSVRQFTVLPIPPRHTMSYTYPWERRHLLGGTGRQWTYPSHSSRRQTTTLWEIESREGLTPQAHFATVTHLWELAHIGEVSDTYYRFALPRNHERVAALWFDHKRLHPVTVRELDNLDDAWYRRDGLPFVWTPGGGGTRSLEVYEIETEYKQAYEQVGGLHGLMRHSSGARTYTISTPTGTSFDFAYTTDGEARALTTTTHTFAGQLARTSPDGVPVFNDGFKPTFLWTLRLNASGHYGTQPWEVAGSASKTGAQRGQFPWAVSHGSITPTASDRPAGLPGTGLRITQDAAQGFQGTQLWEKEMQLGVAAASLTDGVTIGTFPWEALHGATNVGEGPVGLMRRATSPDRQYLSQHIWADPLGTVREWQSSVDDLLCWEVVTPTLPDLVDEADCIPAMIPAPLYKYLGFYVLSQAFNRQGEGYNPNLAAHWDFRFRGAVRFFKRIENVVWRDVQFQREPKGRVRSRIPQPQLPPDYPAVPWLR